MLNRNDILDYAKSWLEAQKEMIMSSKEVNLHKIALEKERAEYLEELIKLAETIRVETKLGTLVATPGADPYFPGISIGIVGKDGFEVDAALVEFHPLTKEINTYVWIDGEEDFHTKITNKSKSN